jgi:hypothetical protein
MLIQLKTKLKLQKDTHRKQRERSRILERAINYKGSYQNEARHQYELYVQKTMELMQKEFDMYEKELKKVLERIGIDDDIWEESREFYM